MIDFMLATRRELTIFWRVSFIAAVGGSDTLQPHVAKQLPRLRIDNAHT